MALVLVDTSVWIDFLKLGETPESRELVGYLDRDEACVTPIIKAEVLSGAKTEEDFTTLQEKFSALPSLQEPPNFWDAVARNRFNLARKGLNVSLIDLAIAVTAQGHDCPILTSNKGFKIIATVIKLRFA